MKLRKMEELKSRCGRRSETSLVSRPVRGGEILSGLGMRLQ